VVDRDPEKWVTLEMNLMNWAFLNFTESYRVKTHLFSIRRILEEKHGRMMDLKICLNSFAENNEMADEMLTLEDYFDNATPKIEGKSKNEEKPTIVRIFYDFRPHDADEPNAILLNWTC
tara:strand:+ start:231 stop:587 length:357 start_codon:yes stop_codon:yes gene_type:complete